MNNIFWERTIALIGKKVIAGLKAALRQGCGRFSFCMDSELIVRQLEGRYKVRHEQLLPLYQEAKTLLARFDAWQVRHVPRTQNQTADALANADINPFFRRPRRR